MKMFQFAKFEREQIEKEINLKEEAEKDGGLNRPPANAKEKSSAERLVIKNSRGLLDKEINRAHSWLTPLIKAIDNLNLKKIDIDILYDKGIINKKSVPVKILGNGDIKNSIEVSAHFFSQSAIKKIEKSGGKVIYL